MKKEAITTVSLVVTGIDELIAGVKRFVLEDADQWPLPPFRPGAHIDIHLAPGLVRTYSLCNEPNDNRRYVIGVKREENGRSGSRYLHDAIKLGDKLGVSLPRGGIEVNPSGPNIFVAGGIGITPFISAIRDMESAGKTNYVLHWASRGEPSLADMLKDAIAANRVRLYNTHIDASPDINAIVASGGDDSKAFCCGPTGMLDAFENAVSCWPESRMHVERFVAPKVAPSPECKPYTVFLARSNKEALVHPETGLLHALESLEANVSVSCAGGICGACRTPWLEGPPIHRDRVLGPDERRHKVIVCVAECAGPRLVLDI